MKIGIEGIEGLEATATAAKSVGPAEKVWNFHNMKTDFDAVYTEVTGITPEAVAKTSRDFLFSPGKTFVGEPRFSIYFEDANGLGQTRWSDHYGDLMTSRAPLQAADGSWIAPPTEFVHTPGVMKMGHVYFEDVKKFGSIKF